MEKFAGLFDGLFDDAAMFSPNSQSVEDAFPGYLRHRLSWYADTVGSLVCRASRIRALGELVTSRRVQVVDVSLVVPQGPPAAAAAAAAAAVHPSVAVRTVTVALGNCPLPRAVEVLAALVTARRQVAIQMPASTITEAGVHRLARAGIQITMPVGVTSLHGFVPEPQLARALVACAAEGLGLTFSSGIRDAVRAYDPTSLRPHHGYLNIALAARLAAGTGNVRDVTRMLSITDPATIVGLVRALTARDIAAIRRLMTSVASFDVAASVAHLHRLGLAIVP